jgi:hypothetical protein
MEEGMRLGVPAVFTVGFTVFFATCAQAREIAAMGDGQEQARTTNLFVTSQVTS